MPLSGSQRSILVLIGQGWDVRDRGDDPVRFTEVLIGPHWTVWDVKDRRDNPVRFAQVLIGPYWSSLDRVGM